MKKLFYIIIKLYFCNTINETATSNKLKIKIMTTAIQNNKLVVKKVQSGNYKGTYKGYNFNIWFNNDELKMWLMSVERENSTYYLNDYANTKSFGLEMIIDIIDNNFYE